METPNKELKKGGWSQSVEEVLCSSNHFLRSFIVQPTLALYLRVRHLTEGVSRHWGYQSLYVLLCVLILAERNPHRSAKLGTPYNIYPSRTCPLVESSARSISNGILKSYTDTYRFSVGLNSGISDWGTHKDTFPSRHTPGFQDFLTHTVRGPTHRKKQRISVLKRGDRFSHPVSGNKFCLKTHIF